MTEQHRWVLVETLGPEPLVVAIGDRAKQLTPLRSVLRRNPNADLIVSHLSERRSFNGEPTAFAVRGGKTLHVRPVAMTDGTVHGAQFWIGEQGQLPPPLPLAGAAVWDISRHITSNSEESLVLSGSLPQAGKPSRTFAEDFYTGNYIPDEAELFAFLTSSHADATFASTWTIQHANCPQIHVRFLQRRVDETGADGLAHRLARGVEIRVASPPAVEPQPLAIARQISLVAHEPGAHRGLVNLRNLALWHWWDKPLPGMAWRYDPDIAPGIHPDDVPKAQAMRSALSQDEAAGDLRLRSEDGNWLPVHVTASLVHIGATSAALVSFRLT